MFNILISFQLFLIALGAHPYYVSLWDVLINKDSQTVQISVKVFLDDLEKGLSLKEYQLDKWNWASSVDSIANKHNKALHDYLQKSVKVSANGKAVKLNYLGREQELEFVYAFIESEKMAEEIKELDMKLTFLTEVIEDQMNIVHVKWDGEKKSFLIHKNETELSWKKK
ncbi:hypothetical protein EP331_08190 [bacterium]|nr:MAG: hypothetical protein EP331_08190 [bacterium]